MSAGPQQPRAGYAIVTPARNERLNLERLAASVLDQRLRPLAWAIVDDGSDDGTGELADALAAREPWIHVVRTQEEALRLDEGRQLGRDLLAFRRGVRALPEPTAVVVKVDADTSFAPDYFERLMARFEAAPDLGIAGGACYELEHGEWVRRRVVGSHPRGASRAYRWACLQAVMELAPRMGWDGLDEVKASLRGFRTQTFTDLAFYHHRPVGGRERDRFRAQSVQGRAAFYMGYRPSYLALRTLYRAARDPAALGMAWGYVASAVTRAERHPEPDVVARLREGQRLGAVLRRGAPP